jgi:digeranylgeranylglycerophospholipid reductase
MSEYDAVICGAGPAGLVTGISILYHKKDAKVVILECREDISEEKCAEGLSKDWIKHIKGLGKYLLSNLQNKCFENEIFGTDIVLPSGKHIISSTKKPNGWVLNKDYFLKNLSAIFKKMGGQIELGINVEGPVMKNNIVYGVETESEKLIRGKCIIDATGLTQNIWRKALNIRDQFNKDDLEVCFQYKIEGCKIENPELLQIHFGEKIAPGGYGWVFPKGKYRCNIGIGCQGSKVENVLPFQEEFWNMLNLGGKIISKKGGTVSSFNLPEEFVWSNLACVGESARFTNPVHGGGTGPAMFGAYILGMHIANALKNNELIEKALIKYQDKIKETRGKAHEYHYRAKNLFQALNDDEIEIVLSSMGPDEWLRSMSFTKTEVLKVIGRIYRKNFKLGLKVTRYMGL